MQQLTKRIEGRPEPTRVHLVHKLARSLYLLALLERARTNAYQRNNLAKVVSLDRQIIKQRHAVALRRRVLGYTHPGNGATEQIRRLRIR